jgi:hypothetical protein
VARSAEGKQRGMSATAAMTLPGGRVLLTWWRDLAGLAPRRLWFAHLILHRVEALVEAADSRPLAALAEAVLSRLARHDTGVSFSDLASDLSLDPGLLHAVLSDLEAQGRARQQADRWQATGASPSTAAPTRQERRNFVFSDGRPVFLPLPVAALTPLAPPAGWRFDLAALVACLNESPAWKERHGFPADVLRLVQGPDWRAVVVDQPAQALLLLVETAHSEGMLLGYGVRADQWTLSSEPVLRCPVEVLTDLGADPGPEGWRQAWQLWCQQRSLPGSEVEACKLEVDAHRLTVRAPARLLDRLRSARSDALKGEAWLLAGTARVRPAAVIDLVEG